MSSLQDRLARDPEPWKPTEAGDSVVGKVLDLTERENGYGVYPCIAVETDDGREVEIHCFHTTLRNEIMVLDLEPGDELGVRFLGKKTSNSGSSYFAYRVVSERHGRPRVSNTREPVGPGTPLDPTEPLPAPELPDDAF